MTPSQSAPLRKLEIAVRWTAIVAVALLPGFLVEPAGIIERLMPLSQASLQLPAAIDFGDLRPNEKKTVSLPIHNRALRRVPLRSVKTDCGCLSVEQSPTQLAARESATITVTIVAPAEPGPVSRVLLVRPLKEAEPVWTIAARATVAADVWSDPGKLLLTLGPDATTETTLTIRHRSGFDVGQVIPSSPRIEVLDRQEDEDEVHLQLRVVASEDAATGVDSLKVYERSTTDEPVLTVPIRWQRLSKIAYVPRRLELPAFDQEVRAGGKLRRVLAVVVPPDHSIQDVQVKTLVPWVQIADRVADGSVLRLELDFDAARMPPSFQEPILSSRMLNDPVHQQLSARGNRS